MRHLEQPYRCIHERGNACYVVHRFNLAQILRPALKNRGNAPRVWYRVSRGFPSFLLPSSLFPARFILRCLFLTDSSSLIAFFDQRFLLRGAEREKITTFPYFSFFSFLHRSSFHVVEKEREKKKLLALQVVHAFML